MYKVLIVDDEYMIREGLKRIIAWGEYGLEITGEAENGKEALEMIAWKKPDIIIADIKMPIMSGLELIKEINRQKLNVRIIVLSGYDEFEFVKNAMKYGAGNYLLKPVSTEELTLAINEIVDDMDKSLVYDVIKTEGLIFFRNSVLNRIIKNEIGAREFKEKDEILKLNLSDVEMRVAVLALCFTQSSMPEEENSMELLLFSILEICEKSIEPQNNCIVFRDFQEHIVFIFKGPEQDLSLIHDTLQKCIQNIIDSLSVKVSVAVGNMILSVRNIHLSYENALKGLDYKIVAGINKVIIYDEINKKLEKCASKIHIKFDLINNLISTVDKDGLISYIELLFLEIEDKIEDVSPEFLRNISGRIIIGILNELRVCRHDADRELNMYDYSIMNKINTADDISILKELVISMACKAVDLIIDLNGRKHSRLVNEIIEYVDENYKDQNISLKILEDKMKISAVHIGRTFKAETGEHFTYYLNKVRVEKARKLLLETDLKIKEISETVGFNNIAYFYTIFKKYTNLNPGDLRHV
jgi:two-component system response regulator YesN